MPGSKWSQFIKNMAAGRERRNKQPIWMTIYTDLMTNLMLFFLMLFATTRLSSGVKSEIINTLEEGFMSASNAAAAEQLTEEDIAERIKNYFSKVGLENFADVAIEDRMIRISYSNPILFDIGNAELRENTKFLLAEVSGLLKEIPNKIIIEGHTDNLPVKRGNFRSNWELSMERALNVIQYFVEEQNVRRERFAAAGYGEYRPVCANDTSENRSKNRRIEINIVRMK